LIVELDALPDPRPTWRDRWLLPAAFGMLLAVVLAASFVRYTPARARVLQAAPPAIGVKAIELPRTLATLETRLQFSGVTGLTSMAMSEGFRDTYALADGRRLFVIEFPAPAGAAATYSGAVDLPHRVAVRGEMGIGYSTDSSVLPMWIAWTADGMQYTLGGAAFSEEELVRLASQLR
jgi:hypothetical protein